MKIAIYPGSFNPFTTGHLNILEKAEAIFGKENVIIAVGRNASKPNPQVAQYASIKAIQENLPSKVVNGYNGFLTTYVSELEAQGHDVTIIRGLRNSFDLQYETNLLRALQDFKPNLKMLMFLCDKQFDHVSSSLYREVAIENKIEADKKYLAKEDEML
jgi:pantetheine-phosphate adenylyltransferase